MSIPRVSIVLCQSIFWLRMLCTHIQRAFTVVYCVQLNQSVVYSYQYHYTEVFRIRLRKPRVTHGVFDVDAGVGHSACATNTVSMVTPVVYSSNITVCSAILLAVVSDVSS